MVISQDEYFMRNPFQIVKSELRCSYKVQSYKKKKSVPQTPLKKHTHAIDFLVSCFAPSFTVFSHCCAIIFQKNLQIISNIADTTEEHFWTMKSTKSKKISPKVVKHTRQHQGENFRKCSAKTSIIFLNYKPKTP